MTMTETILEKALQRQKFLVKKEKLRKVVHLAAIVALSFLIPVGIAFVTTAFMPAIFPNAVRETFFKTFYNCFAKVFLFCTPFQALIIMKHK